MLVLAYPARQRISPTRSGPDELIGSSPQWREGRQPAREPEVWTRRQPAGSRVSDAIACALVEVAGIEPASFSTSPGLLRAQPAVVFSAPAVSQASRRRAQSLLDVPLNPATGPNGGSS